MNKLTIVISGAKQSGKTSLGKYILTSIVNSKIGHNRLILHPKGKEILVLDTFNNNQPLVVDQPSDDSRKIADTYGVKLYSFADPLKEFCINVLGLDRRQCYGTDDDKNSATHISWTDIPNDIRDKYRRPRRGDGSIKPASGYMTGREVMQVFGTDICRKMDTNCWSRGTYSSITKDGFETAVCIDARFPNEITMGTENNAKAIRLLRKIHNDEHESETALNDFPLGEYDCILNNQDLEMYENHLLFSPTLIGWMDQHNIARKVK